MCIYIHLKGNFFSSYYPLLSETLQHLWIPSSLFHFCASQSLCFPLFHAFPRSLSPAISHFLKVALIAAGFRANAGSTGIKGVRTLADLFNVKIPKGHSVAVPKSISALFIIKACPIGTWRCLRCVCLLLKH